MALAEKLIKEHVSETPDRYAARVRWMAVIYLALNLLSVAIIVAIVWRVQFFVTLTQRSNVETLVLLIVMVLAAYYLVSTFGGFVGALRLLWLNMPLLWARGAAAREKVEQRKHEALGISNDAKAAYFDQTIYLEGKPHEPIRWVIGDSTGKLGEIELNGVEAKYHSLKGEMNNTIFEFLVDQLEHVLQKRDGQARLQISQWSTIDEDKAAAYYRMVQAFQNLEHNLARVIAGNEEKLDSEASYRVWPTLEITQEDRDYIGEQLRTLVPVLRNECLLPDVEYEVEWSVPVLPEPLSFMQLTRRENRADPLVTMGCAAFVMMAVLLIVLFFVLWPPWLPSR